MSVQDAERIALGSPQGVILRDAAPWTMALVRRDRLGAAFADLSGRNDVIVFEHGAPAGLGFEKRLGGRLADDRLKPGYAVVGCDSFRPRERLGFGVLADNERRATGDRHLQNFIAGDGFAVILLIKEAAFGSER